MSKEGLLPRDEAKDLNLHVLARIRAEEVIELLHWRKNEQLKSPVISSTPSLPLLSVHRPFEEVVAQRQGTANSRPHEADIVATTNLLANLIVGAGNEASTLRMMAMDYDYSRDLSQGEWTLTAIKAAGYKLSFFDGALNPQEKPRHIEGIDNNSIVKIHNGRVVARGFTSSWYELRESVSVGKIDKGNAAPKTVDEVMAIYAALAASKRTHSGVECFVLRAQTSDEEWELIALAYASEEIPRTVLDNRIHAGRKRQLYEAAAKSTFLPNYLGKEGLTSKEKVIVRDAIEKARSISNFSDVEQLAGFLEVLMRIDRFRALNPGAIAFLVSKLFNDVWSGMGDEGVPNKSVGLGLNGRPI